MTKTKIPDDIFVGREYEIKKLTEHLDWVEKNKKARLVFVHGEAGSGKTTLVKNFLKTIPKKRKLVTGWGVCSLERQGNGLVPFATILDSVNKQVINWKLVGGSFTEFIGKVAPAWLDLLTFGLASPVATTLEEGGKLIKSQKVNFPLENVFIQYTNAIEQISNKRLTILVIDDLHWADKSSLELLFHLVRNIDRCSLLILATYRTVEAMQSGEYASEFQTIHANLIKDSNSVQEIVLTTGLNVKDYVQKRYDSLILSDEMIEHVQESTEGHAIYVAELFNLWEQKGNIVFNGETWNLSNSLIAIELPPSFRGVLQQRIINLNERLQEIITRASVEGDDFTVQTIAKLLEIEEYKMFDEIEELEKNYHLISQKGSEKISTIIFDFYHFAHRFIQQHIYEELSDGKRRILHRQLGLCLEELCTDRNQVAAQLARHFHEARLLDKAIEYAIQASQYEQVRYMWNESYKWVSRASDWAKSLSPSDKTDFFDFQIKVTLGDNFYYQARYIEAEKYYREALGFYSSKQIKVDPNLVGNIYVNLCDICDETSRFEEGIKLVLQGKNFLEESGITSGETYFEIFVMESIILCRLSKTESAYQLIEDLIMTIENQPEKDSLNKVLANTYHTRGIVFSYMSNFSGSIPSYLQAIEIYSSIGNLSRQCFALGALTEDYISTGQFEKARSSSLKALSISQQIGDISGEGYGLYTQGLVLTELNRFDEAIQNFEKAINLAERTGSVPYFYYSDAALAYLNGDTNQAYDFAVKGNQLAGDRIFSKGYTHKVLGIIESKRGNWDKAGEHFDLAIKIMKEVDDKYQLGTLYKFYGRMLKETKAGKKAIKLLNESLKIFSDLEILHEIDNVKTSLGKEQ